MISNILKAAATFCGANLVFLSKKFLARFLFAAGAMALLCTGINIKTIKLIGRWCINEILRYLHVQAKPIMRNFSSLMMSHGKYSFLPTTSPLLLTHTSSLLHSPPPQPPPLAYGGSRNSSRWHTCHQKEDPYYGMVWGGGGGSKL